MKKYQIIYADPPWHYKDKRSNPLTDRPRKYGGITYPVMKTEDICNLPIKEIADDNCILFIWATFPNLQEVFKVIKSWGFEYKTLGFSWIKTNPKNGKPFFGIGHYTKSNCEVCLIGVKGKPIINSNKVSSVIISPINGHSRKPSQVRNKIVELCGELPRIELFARKDEQLFEDETFKSWDVWGNEVESDIKL